MALRFRRCSLHLLLIVVAWTLSSHTLRAQSCKSEMGGASGDGLICLDPKTLDLSAVMDAEYWQRNDSVIESLTQSLIPGLGDNGPGIGSVLGTPGTVHLSSGQFKSGFTVVASGSQAAGGRMSIGATFHSYHVQPGDSNPGNGSIEETEDPESPFGPGWMPSWFQGLLGPVQVPTAGSQPPVTWVDSEGVSHEAQFDQGYGTYTVIGPMGGQIGTSYAYYVWKSAKNARLVYDAARGVFYREYANRVRVEFSPRTLNPQVGELSYWPARICRGENVFTPDWSIAFTYTKSTTLNPSNTDRLTQIKDARGFEISFQWQQPFTNAPWRVTKISIKHSDTGFPIPAGGWSAYDADFEYNGSDRLQYVRFPAWDFLYASNGTVASLGSTTKKGLGLKFAYDGYGVLSDIYRVIKVGSSWTGATEERYLHVTYVDQPGARWKVQSQIEDPDSILVSRTTNIQYSAGDLLLIDPSGSKHRYLRDSQLGQPDSWHVVKYTRETTLSGNRSWDFAWDSCGCGRLQSITLPSGRKIQYGYDGLGRGLLTSVKLTDTSGAQNSTARTWNIGYEPWGAPGSTGQAYYAASKQNAFSYYDASGSTVPWSVGYTWASGVLTANLTLPIGAGTYTVKEDKWERTISIEEPAFSGGGATVRNKTEFAYESSTTNGGYGLLRQVTRYPDGSTPQTTVFTRNSFGQVTQVKDEKGGFTDLTLDPMGNLIQILGPSTTSGADGASPYRPKTVLTRSLFGGVARAQIYAYDEKGNPYPKGSILSESAENFYGELIETSTDGGSSRIQAW